MAKYDLVFDIVEHPEKYTSEQLSEIMSDPETHDIYNLLCMMDSVIRNSEEHDVNAEWKSFSNSHPERPRRFLRLTGSRVASIAVIAGTAIMAVAAGIAVIMSVENHKPEPIAVNAPVTPSVVKVTADTITAHNDTANVLPRPVMFENESLEKIMKEVAVIYGVEVKFKNNEVASLHLYFKLDPMLTLDEIVEQLNTFEQINVLRNGNILTVD